MTRLIDAEVATAMKLSRKPTFNRRSSEDDARTAEGFHLPVCNLLHTFNYNIYPGINKPITISEYQSLFATDTQEKTAGIWYLRTHPGGEDEDFGLYAVHWPTYLKRIAWQVRPAVYLKSQGLSIRSLQKGTARPSEELLTASKTFHGGLRRALPPGSLLMAENTFFQDVMRPFVAEKEYRNFIALPLRESAGVWTFFRFGQLAKTSPTKFETVIDHYAPVSDQSICNVLKLPHHNIPILIRTLLMCMQKARYSDGQGWTKWGLAWTPEGLVFNYGIAIASLQAYHEEYKLLFADTSEDPRGVFLDPTYYLQTPAYKLPRLERFTRKDGKAFAYLRGTIRPYQMLFEDIDRSVAPNARFHNSDFQVLFPISLKDGAPYNLLNYLYDLDQVFRNTLNPTPESTKAGHVTSRLNAAKADKAEKKPHTFKMYGVGFNACHLGSSRPAPLAVLPFNIATVEYRGENYFTLPEHLRVSYPELSLLSIYDKGNTELIMQWTQPRHANDEVTVSVLPMQNQDIKLQPDHAFISLPRVNTLGRPLFVNRSNMRFYHPCIFRPGGEMDNVLDAVVQTRPGLSMHDKHDLETLRNFWGWVYDPDPLVKKGKLSGEFTFSLGYESTHSLGAYRLTTMPMRLNYILDKARHYSDKRVCDTPRLTQEIKQGLTYSSRINSYDNFVIWYAIYHELLEMGCSFDIEEMAEYVAKRWLPWRRPSSLYFKPLEPYEWVLRIKLGQPLSANKMTVQDALHRAKEDFGPSFTEY